MLSGSGKRRRGAMYSGSAVLALLPSFLPSVYRQSVSVLSFSLCLSLTFSLFLCQSCWWQQRRIPVSTVCGGKMWCDSILLAIPPLFPYQPPQSISTKTNGRMKGQELTKLLLAVLSLLSRSHACMRVPSDVFGVHQCAAIGASDMTRDEIKTWFHRLL